MPESIKVRAQRVADKCRDAYSADNYRSWSAVAAVLLREGFSEAEAETFMRSKHTRWAQDHASFWMTDAQWRQASSGQHSTATITRYLNDYKSKGTYVALCADISRWTAEEPR